MLSRGIKTTIVGRFSHIPHQRKQKWCVALLQVSNCYILCRRFFTEASFDAARYDVMYKNNITLKSSTPINATLPNPEINPSNSSFLYQYDQPCHSLIPIYRLVSLEYPKPSSCRHRRQYIISAPLFPFSFSSHPTIVWSLPLKSVHHWQE